MEAAEAFRVLMCCRVVMDGEWHPKMLGHYVSLLCCCLKRFKGFFFLVFFFASWLLNLKLDLKEPRPEFFDFFCTCFEAFLGQRRQLVHFNESVVVIFRR